MCKGSDPVRVVGSVYDKGRICRKDLKASGPYGLKKSLPDGSVCNGKALFTEDQGRLQGKGCVLGLEGPCQADPEGRGGRSACLFFSFQPRPVSIQSKFCP